MAELPDLPEPADRWLRRTLPRGAPKHPPHQIRLQQKGEMGLRGTWTPMRADGVYDATDLGFVWRASLEIRPAFVVKATDGLDDRTGWGEARLWGVVPLGRRKRGPEVARAQLVRNLAEVVWVPHLVVAHPELVVDHDERSFTLAGRAAGAEARVRIVVDEGGDAVAAEADARPYDVPGGGYEQAPWRCDFADHALMSGIRVPMTAEARFDKQTGPFVYWRARITAVAIETDAPTDRS